VTGDLPSGWIRLGAIAAAVACLEIVMSSSGPLRREFHERKLKRVFEGWDLGTID
jgi:hypothetical protein